MNYSHNWRFDHQPIEGDATSQLGRIAVITKTSSIALTAAAINYLFHINLSPQMKTTARTIAFNRVTISNNVRMKCSIHTFNYMVESYSLYTKHTERRNRNQC